ncbi:MAG: hypothetical protein HKN24_10850 [Acidimicrobiales bacterium]|nr:hypothetical protein [Acidimicrobiales bacterium]
MFSTNMSRRAFVAGVAGLTAYGLPIPAAANYLRAAARQDSFTIRPRTDWAGDGRLPTGPLEPEDVRLIVVHHTLIPNNGYSQDQVAKLLRDIYDFHTGPEKGWPDIAYNFMVDQFGDIWEARHGSLDGPVRGSATGGNQGYSQLCCFLGDLSGTPPTERASASMSWLLATLADRYDIDTAPDATVTVDSLGSSRYAAGESMTLSTLSGHRDVSLTACPGEAGYAYLQQTLPGLVNAQRTPPPTTATTEATTTTTASTTTTATSAPTTEAPPTSDTSAVETIDDQLAVDGVDRDEDEDGSLLPLILGGAALAAAGAGIVAIAKRNIDDDGPTPAGAGAVGGHGAVATVIDDTERQDGTIVVPTRLGITDAPSPTTAAATAATASTSTAIAVAEGAPTLERVWWALSSDAPDHIERDIERLAREINDHALNPIDDPDEDRRAWARVDVLLAHRAERHRAAVVAARPDAVFVLRSEPCLVVVTRPDGVQKLDRGRDALSAARGDVARIEVFLHDADGGDHPAGEADIVVMAN